MAYRPQLVVTVAWNGAEFDFVSPEAQLIKLFDACLAAGLTSIDVKKLPPGGIPLLVDVFEFGCVAWRGVEQADGKPLPCTGENRARLPLLHKVELVTEFLEHLDGLQSLETALPETPTVSTPPGSASPVAANADPSTLTSAPSN